MNEQVERITAHRQFFAALVTASVRGTTSSLTAAFSETPRETFVGPGPWEIFVGGTHVWTPTDDPTFLYQDVVVRLRDHINNGQPSLHAICLAALKVGPGETAVHVGAGTGYYTAVLARLLGPSGRVYAYEVEPDLAQRAIGNLVDFPNVEVRQTSATGVALPETDVIYVNAGATHPLREWLAALRVGGRLLFPLTSNGPGAMLLVTRSTASAFEARFVCAAMFIPCLGARDEATAASLTRAFARGDAAKVRSLQIDTVPDDTVWCAGEGWWLSSRPAY